MKSVLGKRFGRVLEIKGWILIRINGSHHIYRNIVSGEKN
jgi:predicted RNA binding protein YcfA (HicA-like mRNA interferase family)